MTEVLEKPDTVVELDVDLDIEPACVGVKNIETRERCDEPAEWVCRVVCDNCNKNRLGIYCEPHRAGMHPGGAVACSKCHQHTLSILTEVRL